MTRTADDSYEHGSKWYDVARFSIRGSARDDFESMRDATKESETVLVITDPGVAYRVIPKPTPEDEEWSREQDDTITVWGISDHTHPDTGYSRFKALGDAELETVPIRMLCSLAVDRVRELIGR